VCHGFPIGNGPYNLMEKNIPASDSCRVAGRETCFSFYPAFLINRHSAGFQGKKPRYYSRFYMRRALRILPPYYGVAPGPAPGWKIEGIRRLKRCISGETWSAIFGVVIAYPPLWSLAVERAFFTWFGPQSFGTATGRRLFGTIAAIVVILPDASLELPPTRAFGTRLYYLTWLVAGRPSRRAERSPFSCALPMAPAKIQNGWLIALGTVAILALAVGTPFGIFDAANCPLEPRCSLRFIQFFCFRSLLLTALLVESRRPCEGVPSFRPSVYISYGRLSDPHARL